ncbi:unnamed protein product [Ixodes persulcatus]
MSGQASLCPFRVPSRRSVPSGCCRDPAGLRARGGVVRFSQRPAGPSQVVAGTSMRASSADPPCPVDTTERRAPADARHRGTSPGSCVCVWCGACQCGAVQCSRGPPCYLCAGRWLARTSLSCGSFPRPTRERRLGPARWRRGRLELACVYSKPSVGPVLGRRVAGSLRRSWTPKNGVPPRRPPSIGGCRPRAPQGAFRGAPRVVCPKTPEDSGMLSPLDYRTRWTGRPASSVPLFSLSAGGSWWNELTVMCSLLPRRWTEAADAQRVKFCCCHDRRPSKIEDHRRHLETRHWLLGKGVGRHRH